MCGRYALYEVDKIQDRFGAHSGLPLKPNFNVAPTQTMPVIRSIGGTRKLDLLHWGIPRMLGKDLVKEIINTRADKAFGGFWRKQVTTRRCLVPANAFYEWKKLAGSKLPYVIGLPGQQLYAFAGIWNNWTDQDGNSFDAYSIMTTEPNAEMQQIHDRMPVILHPDDEATWLQGDTPQDIIAELLLPPEDGLLTMYVGSNQINNVRNNDRSLLEPVE